MKVVIRGKKPLNGKVELSGCKKSALLLIGITLASSGRSILRNVPDVPSVRNLLRRLENLGADVAFSNNACEIDTSNISPKEFRISSFLDYYLISPLLVRGIPVYLPKIVKLRRDLTPLFDSEILSVDKRSNILTVNFPRTETTLNLENLPCVSSALAIELASMIASEFSLVNMCESPEILDLVRALREMGANIKEEKLPNNLVIKGVRLLDSLDFTVASSYMEPVLYSACVGVASGYVEMRGANSETITSFLVKLGKIGLDYEMVPPNVLRVWKSKEAALHPVEIAVSEYPGFIPEWTGPTAALLTQANGSSIFYNCELPFANELNRMGAKLTYRQGSFLISGRTNLFGKRFDLKTPESGLAILVSALAASGKTIINNADVLNSVVEFPCQKLQALGADISIS